MSPHLRAVAAALALGLAFYVGAAYAQQPVLPSATQVALQRDAARMLVAEAMTLYDARRLIRLPGGGFDRPPSDSESDRQRARELLIAAGRDGDVDARDFAGRMMQAGVGGPVDLGAARKLYEESATRSARWRLAGMLERGEGGPRDAVSARALYKLASDQGQLDARYDFARMARRGFGGPVDSVAARAALHSMITTCHTDAANDLAQMSDRGEGGPRDLKLAAEQYLRAVECRSRFYLRPLVSSSWESVGQDTRAEINRLLRERGLAEAPASAASPSPGWEDRYVALRKESPAATN